MKKTTLLVIAVFLLLVIAEESEGKITILHNGRVSGAATRRQSSRRPAIRKSKTATKTERNHAERQDQRLPKVTNRARNTFC